MRACLAALALLVGIIALAPATASAAPPCLGAASRDPDHPCNNPRLRLQVSPKPDEALLTPNLQCATSVEQAVAECGYGAPPASARGTIAVLGDSHGAHWRGGLDVMAKGMRWHVQDFSTARCSFTALPPPPDGYFEEFCPRHNREIVAYLTAHPEIKTVFVSAYVFQLIDVEQGKQRFSKRVQGFLDQWALLPDSVKRVVVLRDTPRDRITTFDCVRKAIRRRKPAGSACRAIRKAVHNRDPEVVAARRATGRRFAVLDFTRQFCGPKWCYPVVGGVLVHKDMGHMGQPFARTLGPIILREVRARFA